MFGILLLLSLCPLAGTGVLPLTLEGSLCILYRRLHVLLILWVLLSSMDTEICISSFSANEVLPGRFPYTMTYQQWLSTPLHPEEGKAQAIVLK